MRPAVGSHRQVHQNGPFHCAPNERQDSIRPGEDIRTRGLEVPWPAS